MRSPLPMRRSSSLFPVLATAIAGLLVAVAAADSARFGQWQFADADAGLSIELWSELADDGALRSFYQASLDGRASEPLPRADSIDLALSSFDPLVSTPVVARELAAGADTNVYLVQYYTQPFEAFQKRIEALGGRVNRVVGSNAISATLPPGTAALVAAQPEVRWVGAYEPAYRLEREVLARVLDASAGASAERYSIEVNQRGPEQQESLRRLIESLGGVVHFVTPEGFRMEATLSREALLRVARADEVNFIDRWGGPGGFDDENARGPAGSSSTFIFDTLGFLGEGVRGEVFDGGLRTTHVAFQTPNVLMHSSNTTDTSHGTNCYGIVFGSGASNPSARGFLPNREQGIFAVYSSVTMFGGSKTRHQHTAELVDPDGAYRAVLQSSSVGSSWTTTYTTISAEVDDYLFLHDLLSCQSQSNQGTTSSRPQAWAKNIVSVGGIRHYNNANRADDNWASGASVGPAADGRIKPDLAHFYDSVDTTANTSDTAYRTNFGGTSAATPITAGAFGILFQMWHEGVWPGHGGGATVFDSRPKMATAKALMINGAYQYAVSASEPGYTDLTRVRQGWGMANLENLYNDRLQTFIVNETDPVLPLGRRVYYTRIAPGAAKLKATMVYTDLPGNPSVQTQHRVNDLSLRVTAPGSTAFYWGNNGLSSTRWSTPGGSANTKDNVENVFVQTPGAGFWKVEVIGSEIVQDARPESPNVIDADFALVVNGGSTFRPGDANCDGVINFDDIDAFVAALSGPAAYAVQYPDCTWLLADANLSDAVDFDDIDAFVALLGS
ncbi:MAG: S8 family serine peptidase [Phycisphaerales bacterium]|nr:S8 family serine peptidase [Phycisphaerales bacterium]